LGATLIRPTIHFFKNPGFPFLPFFSFFFTVPSIFLFSPLPFFFYFPTFTSPLIVMQLKTLLASVPMVMTLAMQVAGQISQVVDANNFCVYLPPPDSANRNIADTEWNAQAFCMGNTPKALKANKMPDGFIQSAHFVVTDKYIQVTGQIDPAKANLNVTDEGGQMDVAARKFAYLSRT
jgi:hypothetical protein